MTGDRMINLAKTPANSEFQSKYYKPHTTTATQQASIEEGNTSSLPNSPTDVSTSQTTQQNNNHQRRKPVSQISYLPYTAEDIFNSLSYLFIGLIKIREKRDVFRLLFSFYCVPVTFNCVPVTFNWRSHN